MTIPMRYIVIATIASLLSREACGAQGQPATIPTVVAQSMNLYYEGMFGRTKYVVGIAPADWPKDLIPARARLIGGGTVGSAETFRMRTLVVEVPANVRAKDFLSTMAARAGYAARTADGEATQGGFMNSPGKTDDAPLCKGTSSLFSFRPVDSIATPRIYALHYLDGEVATQNCDVAARARMMRGGARAYGPRSVPTLVAPRGVEAIPTGSNWSGSSGETRTMLRTTMPVDSILMHYTTQLMAAGWKIDGSLLANSSVGIQKYTFRDAEEPWSATLILMAVGDRRDMGLRLSRVYAEH